MHIVKSKFKAKSGKVYETVLLRESYREGKKVKKRTIANLSSCSPEEIEAIKLALKHKADLSQLGSCKLIRTEEGLSVGAAYVVFETAKRLGIVDALGYGRNGQLALWQVIARVIDQGSRLSAIRMAEIHAIASVIGLDQGFTEDDLYKNLSWLSQSQPNIERQLYEKKFGKQAPFLFLYDVTSSYLEGEHNELADWGYNRDKKKGKKQIVIGLLCAEDGTPVATEVFKGNTSDVETVANQIEKVKNRFGCEKIVLVGDRGMIKSGQITDLQTHGLHYITAITRKQIKTLLKKDIIRYELFDTNLMEVINDNIRYVLRRNPIRAQEIAEIREGKLHKIEQFVEVQNTYLQEHSRALPATAIKKIEAKIKKLNIDKWVSLELEGRSLRLKIDKEALQEASFLDGCYVIKTDLIQSSITPQTIHDRYKDLAHIERAFRTCKSNLDIRPIFVRSAKNTRGHVLVVFLAYLISRTLDASWSSLYLTVDEGLASLSTLCALKVSVSGKTFQQIPEPRQNNKDMLAALDITLPRILPENHAHVVTRTPRRKSVSKI